MMPNREIQVFSYGRRRREGSAPWPACAREQAATLLPGKRASELSSRRRSCAQGPGALLSRRWWSALPRLAMATASTRAWSSAPPWPCEGEHGLHEHACSTPFVSAPSSPTRDRDPYPSSSHFFFSAPTSPGGGGKDTIPGVLDFDFDFSSRFPSPSATAMSSTDELFHNSQIRPVRRAAAAAPGPGLAAGLPPRRRGRTAR